MGKLLAGQRSISWALLFCCCFVSPFCRRQTDGLQLSTSAAEAGGGSKGIKHPTTNWLRQSVPRPSKGGQWGAGSLGWGWKSFVRPSKGAARRLALQRLSGRLSPCGWGPCVSMVVGCLTHTLRRHPWPKALSYPQSKPPKTQQGIPALLPRFLTLPSVQASHHQLASPIGPPPFKGRT